VSQQLARQAARRSVFEIQVALRRERADRERRLEALAITVLTALGERDVLVRDAELWTGQALRTMTDDEGLSLREAVDWCGSGITVREITRLLRLDGAHQGGRDGSDELDRPDCEFEADALAGLTVCGGGGRHDAARRTSGMMLRGQSSPR
jgi:hypothetical protein